MEQDHQQWGGKAGHVVPSQELLNQILPHLEKVGVTRVADLTGLDAVGIPVCAAHRPNARSLAVAHGKGATIDDAKVSAVMEAVELSCAEAPALPLRLATALELSSAGQIIELDRLPMVEGRSISLDRTALWAEGRTIEDDRPIWIPYELIHMDYTLPLPPRLGCFVMSSTGLASGSTFKEAVNQAMAEAIERDAITLWKQQSDGPTERRIDLDSVNDPACADLLERFSNADVACAIWDVGSDLAIPTFYATIIDRQDGNRRGLHAASGAGSHPDRGIALFRALTEAAQSRLTLISGARDDRSRAYYRMLRDAETLNAQRSEITEAETPRRFDDVTTHPVRSVDESLSCMLAAFKKAGVGAPVAVDLSRVDIPAAVVRVVVPGLEGTSDAPGYKPGDRAMALE